MIDGMGDINVGADPGLAAPGINLFEDTSADKRSYSSQYADDQSAATRTFQVVPPDAATGISEQDRYNIARSLLGANVLLSEGVGGVIRRWISRFLPAAMPPMRDDLLNNLLLPTKWASKIERCWPMSGKLTRVDENGLPVYADGVYMTVAYSSYPFFIFDDGQVLPDPGGSSPLREGVPATAHARPDEGDALRRGWVDYSRYISRDIQPAPKMGTIPGSMMRYGAGGGAGVNGAPIPYALPFSQYRANVKYTWHAVPIAAIPWDAIQKLSDRVNNDPFDVFPKGTLKFSSPAVRQYRGRLGDMLADMTYSFVFMPNYSTPQAKFMGWNSVPARTTANIMDYVEVTADGAALGLNNGFYLYGDMAALFRPPQG